MAFIVKKSIVNRSLIVKKSGTGELLYNPIAFWHLEESSGNRIDATNNSYTLSEGDTSVGSAIGKIGNAANFNGTTSKFLTNSSISVGSTFSISCWFKLNSYNPNNEKGIWGCGTSGNHFMSFYIVNSNNTFRFYNEGVADITTSFIPVLNTWYHTVITVTPNGAKLYIDGNLIDSVVYDPSFDSSWTNFSLSNFYIDGPAGYPIDAVIDEAGVWDIELSQEQITNIYRNIPTIFRIKKTPFLPSSLGGLALWLKADAGVTIATSGPYTYVSQIVITGSNTPNVNGTYNASSVPTFDFEGNPEPYFLTGPTYTIAWYPNQFELETDGFYGLWTSSDGINWTVSASRADTITISGSTTPDVNGVYTRPSGQDVFYGPTYAIENYSDFVLLDQATSTIYYTASSATGPWTIVDGSGAITSTSTLAPRGSITATKVVSSSVVTAWADQSGNGNNASSSEGTRPTFVSNILNAKPVLRFDGAGQQMALTASIGGTEYSIFIVCKNNDNTNGSMFFWSTDQNYAKYIGSVTAETYNANPRNKFILSENDVGSGEGDSIIAWSSTAVNNNYFIGTAMQNGGGKAYSNGSGGTDSLGTFGASNTFNLIGGYDFGYELDGDVAEIIAYNRALTISERQQVEAYLNSKYQIY